MPRIGAFWDMYPDIELELLPAGKLVDLRRDNVDVALRYGKGGWAGAKVTRLMAAGHVAVAAPNYLKDRRVDCLSDPKNGFGWRPIASILNWKTSPFFKLINCPAKLRAQVWASASYLPRLQNHISPREPSLHCVMKKTAPQLTTFSPARKSCRRNAMSLFGG
jgi:DNA-binding transcriptional LysR family regulator